MSHGNFLGGTLLKELTCRLKRGLDKTGFITGEVLFLMTSLGGSGKARWLYRLSVCSPGPGQSERKGGQPCLFLECTSVLNEDINLLKKENSIQF